jgi:hypothetical protein
VIPQLKILLPLLTGLLLALTTFLLLLGALVAVLNYF